MNVDYNDKNNNIPGFLILAEKITKYFPKVNSVGGLVLYSFIIYIFMLGIRMFCSVPYKEEENDIEEFKSEREKKLKDQDFINKIKESRKIKHKEAINLLNKIK